MAIRDKLPSLRLALSVAVIALAAALRPAPRARRPRSQPDLPHLPVPADRLVRPHRPGALVHAGELGADRHDVRAAHDLSGQAAAGRVPRGARGRRRLPEGLEGSQDVHVHAPPRLPVQRRDAGPRERVCPCDQPGARARHELAGGRPCARHRRRSGCARGRRTSARGVDGARQHPRRPAHPARSRLPDAHDAAVLLRRPADAADRSRGRPPNFPGAGPYYVAEYRPLERVVIRRNRFYGGNRPHHVDGFHVDLRLPRRRRWCNGSSGARPTGATPSPACSSTSRSGWSQSTA